MFAFDTFWNRGKEETFTCTLILFLYSTDDIHSTDVVYLMHDVLWRKQSVYKSTTFLVEYNTQEQRTQDITLYGRSNESNIYFS